MDFGSNGTDLDKEQIENLINMINFSHKSVQLEGLTGLREFISMGLDCKFFSRHLILNHLISGPIQKVVDSGIVPKLLEILTWENETRLQVTREKNNRSHYE